MWFIWKFNFVTLEVTCDGGNLVWICRNRWCLVFVGPHMAVPILIPATVHHEGSLLGPGQRSIYEVLGREPGVAIHRESVLSTTLLLQPHPYWS